MQLPELKEIYLLTLADFQRHSVWVGVHNLDFDEPWYEVTNEDTFRPWMEAFPVSANTGFVLVAATFELRDKRALQGYIKAAPEDWDRPLLPRRMRNGGFTEPKSHSSLLGGSSLALLKFQSPHIFVGIRQFGFWGHWGSRLDKSMQMRQKFYEALGKRPNDIFPITFHADPKLATGILSGRIDGFYRLGLAGDVPEIVL